MTEPPAGASRQRVSSGSGCVTAHGVLTHHFQPRVARQVDVDMLGVPIAAEEFMRRSGS
ncbi:hypothetical protein O981_03620 [Mycobacterium avium 10-5560]|nr:hypothetical protein N602_03215 [Mycobacterium avium subsp. hominissuis 10-5606]ETB55505.1 hypothetical protein O981_03620 [Mycobacterium avium 10-5560]ETZ44471.1 hypothetical protein L838_4120 [Mycobacterium avium MAV_120709_2344]ETZ50309.1 hypothetical protein L837_1070 [Mycobacterium avium MAV_061107_1842]